LLLAVKDFWGRFHIPRWQFSNLGEFDPLKSVFLFLTDSTRWELEEERIDPQTPLPLRSGWNGIAYLPSQPMTPQEAFRSLQGNLIFVRDGEGRFWWVEEEFNNLGDLIPGKGYLLKLRNADTLVFPLPEGFFASNVSSSSPYYSSLPPGVIPTSTDPYLILLHWETSPPQGVVWAKGGNGEIVGGAWVQAGDRQTGIAIWGTDPLGKKGLAPQEPFSLTFQLTKYPSQESVTGQPIGQEFPLQLFPTQALFFTPDSFARVASSLDITAPLITLNIYPNPFNSLAHIEVQLPEYTTAQAEIWDLQGRRLLSRVISRRDPGISSFYWDATDYPSGVYLFQMDISSVSGLHQRLREKLLLVR
ncbi:MAG: T9SS type A sorting domain-containing protein, partial [bacterium]